MAESEMVERLKAALRDKTDWTIDGKLGEAEAEESLTEAARASFEAMRNPPEYVLDAMNPSGRYAGIVVPEAWNDAIDAALSPSPATEKRNG